MIAENPNNDMVPPEKGIRIDYILFKVTPWILFPARTAKIDFWSKIIKTQAMGWTHLSQAPFSIMSAYIRPNTASVNALLCQFNYTGIQTRNSASVNALLCQISYKGLQTLNPGRGLNLPVERHRESTS